MSKLNQNEWPDGVVDHMADSVFTMAFGLRELTQCVMIPSPNPKAHVRWDNSTSQHAIGIDGNRKSTGTDWFGRNDQAERFWYLAQRFVGLGGFGVYFDSKLHGEKRVMYHGDVRAERLLWLCPDKEDREYIYYHKQPVRFLKVLSEEFAKL